MSEREYPEQDYFPSCKARLIIRFEEFDGQTSVKLDDTRVNVRKGEGTGQQPPPEEVGAPQAKNASIDGLTHVLAGIIPKTASIGRNGIRTADTASLSIKYADMPFDPRTIRACAVEIYMGSVSPDDFAAGLSGRERSIREGSTEILEPLNVVPDSFVDDNGRRRSNLRFQGWVDDWDTEFGDDEPLINLECVDNTRQLIGQDAPPQLLVDAELGIAEAIAQYLGEFPQFRGFTVQYLPLDGGQPKLDTVLGKTARKKDKGPAPGDGDSVWDYLTDVCGMVAHNIRFEGTQITVQRVRELFAGEQGREDDPFVLQGGRVISGIRYRRRLFVYGRNVEPLGIRRTFTQQAAVNVEARSYNPVNKEVVIARHPPFKEDRQTKANPGDEGEQTYRVIRVPGVTDRGTLGLIAQEAYEQVNRREVEVAFETKNLASYGGGWSDPDALDMQAGDFVDVQVQREEEELQAATVLNLENTLSTRQRGIDLLTALGFDERLAATYTDAFINVGLVSSFLVRQVSLDWDEDEGITIGCEAVNFAVVARSDFDQPAEES